MQQERRRAPRYSTRIDAWVAVERELLCPCTVLDINDYGARLELAAGQPVPDELYLIDPMAIVGYQARVHWRQAPMAGLRFVRSWDLAARTTPLWLQAMRAEAIRLVGERRGLRLVKG